MRSLAVFCELAILLPMALVRPFVGVLLWSWISFMSPQQMMWGFAADIPWAQIIFMVTVIGIVISDEPKRFPVNGVTVSIILFMIGITFTSIFAMSEADYVWGKWQWVEKICLFLLITATLVNSKERLHAMIWVMVLSLVYFGINGGGFTIVHGGSDKVLGPPNTIIGDNNHLAAALLVSLPLMNYLRLQSAHYLIRLGLLATMVLTVFAVVGSYSRGALIGLLAVASYLWWKSPKKVISGALVVGLVITAITFMPDSWVQRMGTINSYQQDSSAEGRLNIWFASWVMAVKRPLTGAGFHAPYEQNVVDEFVSGVTARAVHSIWFEPLGEHGFPTFFAWLGILISAAYYARRTVKLTKDVPGLEWASDMAKMTQVSMLAYVTAGSFLSLSYWDFYLTLMVVVAALYDHVSQAVAQPKVQPGRLPVMPTRLALSRQS